MMTDEQFWTLVGAVDRDALDEGDEEASLAPLVEALADSSAEDIKSFEDHLSTALYRLDGERYANEAGISGGSDDGFLYARAYVVAKGRGFYESVLKDPAKMPKRVDYWCESLLSVSASAWEASQGDEWDYFAEPSYETGSNVAQWPSLGGS